VSNPLLGSNCRGVKLGSRFTPSVQAIKLILLTGCRASEILSLRWTDWQGDRLAVCGKTGKRMVFLGAAAENHLGWILEMRRWRKKDNVSAYIFPSPRDPARRLMSITDMWKSVLRKAEISLNLRLQDLRHTFASVAISNGESMQVTGLMLGHRRLSTTERYAHLDDKHIRAANQRISDAIERAVMCIDANSHAYSRAAKGKPRRLRQPTAQIIDRPPAAFAPESP